ncbi:conserved hypothetical protein [Trichinella spiralis]|uniref:hypothetical protein n=1 Tax=Trichinella spiralis TaxID=6334 RepID=UPI0001EFE2FD|nr:conserved hypothetical protein [Trichinella spiralis]
MQDHNLVDPFQASTFSFISTALRSSISGLEENIAAANRIPYGASFDFDRFFETSGFSASFMVLLLTVLSCVPPCARPSQDLKKTLLLLTGCMPSLLFQNTHLVSPVSDL